MAGVEGFATGSCASGAEVQALAVHSVFDLSQLYVPKPAPAVWGDLTVLGQRGLAR